MDKQYIIATGIAALMLCMVACLSFFLAIFLMLSAFGGLIYCAKKQKSAPELKPQLQPVAYGLMICIFFCAIVIFVGTNDGADEQEILANELIYAKSSYFTLGKFLAEKYPNSKVLVITERTDKKSNLTPIYLEAFQQGAAQKLKIKKSKITLSNQALGNPGKEKLTEPEDAVFLNCIKAVDFDKLIEKYPDCQIIVSFAGLPVDIGNMEIWSMNPKDRPKLALINGSCYHLTKAIKAGAFVAVVTKKPGLKYDDSPPPDDVQKAFNRQYLLVTPGNIGKIAQQYKVFK